ncbi:thiol:disulfide interchange protein [Methylomonas koyamae]|uniref:Thiol:disulfide interchange protein n=1 Tax=Methylomonas koyamae TaxID=702114 RepID=A0A177NQ65_9GAMM|nr:protein-disulfide reductase DsbD domain-containing protein [Methylomonas koyamae]OAI19180.1 thiol:disulfide interchange protein [Methylomonas koyamae]
MSVTRYLPILVAILCGPTPASAESSTEAATEQVKVQLLASAAAVHPGDQIWIGVHQKIIPHWHTYWLNPGDSGLATKIQYQLPAGSSVGEIKWPTPSKIVLGPVVNYGYEEAVTLLSPFKVAADAPVGGELPISAKVKWLVCAEICIPQQAELALRLPVVAAGAAVGPGSTLVERAKASWPTPSPWHAEVVAAADDTVKLRLTGANLAALRERPLWFYPEQWGPIAHGFQQQATVQDDAVEILLKAGDQPLAAGETLRGVVAVGANGKASGYQISAVWPAITTAKPFAEADALPGPIQTSSELTLSWAVLFALAGGLILNLMPCVFPVLSLKALALFEQAKHQPGQTRRHGWAYAAGVLASFAGLAGLMIALKAGGAVIGWGFQFQSPLFVLIVAYLLFAVGLSLSGVFTFGSRIAGIGSGLAARGGYQGSFFTGVLAAVVATPCTAPFMGAAIGFAVTQPAVGMLAVFLSLGAGLALPYWLLCHWPALQRRLPKPGAWMETLKQGLAFPMYATAAWLIWVLARQAGPDAVAAALLGLVLIGLAAWLYQISRPATDFARHLAFGFAILALTVALAGGAIVVGASGSAAIQQAGSDSKAFEVYSAKRLSRLRAAGTPVFVNFTADWCITCLVNEKVALANRQVLDSFRERGVVYLKGDWTNRDPAIAEVLAQHGRSGVPLYLYFAPGAQQAAVLPQLLTPDLVIGAVKGASL